MNISISNQFVPFSTSLNIRRQMYCFHSGLSLSLKWNILLERACRWAQKLCRNLGDSSDWNLEG